MIHSLKLKSEYFREVVSGNKTFESRIHDRDFRVGDFIRLNEIESRNIDNLTFNAETGSFIIGIITYILDDPFYCHAGYVIFSFKVLEVHYE